MGVGTVMLRPEWLGMKVAPVEITRTDVARPSLDLAVPAPPDVLPSLGIALEPPAPAIEPVEPAPSDPASG